MAQSAGTILVVEDAVVSNFLKVALTQRGYEVICAQAADAQVFIRDAVRKIDLLITNVPAAFAEFPDLPLLYMAALPDPEAIQPFRRCLSLRKPFHTAQLFATMEQLLT